jgi:ribosomal protein L3 glutamine methyltransferase
MTRSAEALEHCRSGVDWIRYAASRFAQSDLAFGQGSEDALDEARWLVMAALAWDPEWSADGLAGRLLPDEKARILELIERRIQERRPLAYLVGETYFFGLRLKVDERVLIPRSPIGELLDQHFEPWIESAAVRRILDYGTGSGALAIGCALAFPDSEVDAVDASAEALAVAAVNRDRYGLAHRLNLREGRRLEVSPKGPYDLIVSNPPYVDDRTMAHLPPEFAAEPRLALTGGSDGLSVIGPILAAAGDCLAPGGILVMEAGSSSGTVRERWPQFPWIWPDLASGRPDVLIARAADLVRLTGAP